MASQHVLIQQAATKAQQAFLVYLQAKLGEKFPGASLEDIILILLPPSSPLDEGVIYRRLDRLARDPGQEDLAQIKRKLEGFSELYAEAPDLETAMQELLKLL